LWPCIAEKWRGEFRTPKVEYFASRGLHSKRARASWKSPSRAAETNRSPDAEQPNELPMLTLTTRNTFSTYTSFGSPPQMPCFSTREREKKKCMNRRMPRPLAHSFTVPPFHIFGDCCILWQDA
jgi:hypothetical protein